MMTAALLKAVFLIKPEIDPFQTAVGTQRLINWLSASFCQQLDKYI